MKLGLMTWYGFRNYGTALQAAALFHVLRELGHEPRVIQYAPYWYFPRVPDYRLKPFLKRLLRLDQTQTTGKKKEFCSPQKEALFAGFGNEHLRFTEPCPTEADLERLNDQFDAFVCGSDQIWAPICFNPKYYLDFVHDPRKKIAYAPSLGVRSWDDLYIKHYAASLLRDFGSLSVREEAGRRLIRECSGRDAELVLDPTLLLTGEEWAERFSPKDPPDGEPYLLAYLLGDDPENEAAALHTAQQLGLTLRKIPITENELNEPASVKEPVGPAEFLGLVRKAAYVCTDSFHGLIFSLLFHRSFTALPRFQKRDPNNQNSRVQQLLDTVSMPERLFNGKNAGTIAAVAPDFGRADAALRQRREESLAYLTRALAGVGQTKTGPLPVMEQNSLCCGCGACATVCPTDAIRVVENADGFLTARVDNAKCIRCGKCTELCPFCTGLECVSAREQATLFSFKNGSPEALLRSSSGGAADALARLLIEQGYTVAGCRYNRASSRSEHVLVRSVEELGQLQGSKYIQSRFSDALRALKACDGPVAVFGTPCQIAGARRALRGRENAVFIDLVCHGVPSAQLYRRYLEYIRQSSGVDPARAEMIFRYKPVSWRRIHLYASDGEHSYCREQKQDPFFRMYENGTCYSPACYECRWRVDSEADLRLADYWGPRFERDETGVSMVVCFTPKGQSLAERLHTLGALQVQPIQDYLDYQAHSNPREPVFYTAVLRDLKDDSIRFQTLVDKYATQIEDRSLSRKERLQFALRMIAYDEKRLKP